MDQVQLKDKLWVTQKEAAALLGCGKKKVTALLEAGEIKAAMDGNRLKISQSSLRDYVARMTGELRESVGLQEAA